MRISILTLSLIALASAASADTLQEVTSHGITVTAPGITFDVAYTPDGKFTVVDSPVTGAWRIDGDKLCTRSSVDPDENCVAYPKGKKSGDSFGVTGPRGSATVTIK